jgi:hypothetical protein
MNGAADYQMADAWYALENSCLYIGTRARLRGAPSFKYFYCKKVRRFTILLHGGIYSLEVFHF